MPQDATVGTVPACGVEQSAHRKRLAHRPLSGSPGSTVDLEVIGGS